MQNKKAAAEPFGGKPHRWQPGESGNPQGRKPTGKTLSDALRAWVTNGRREELLVALWALAKGHWVQETDKKGEERVYLASPDVKAISLIFERIDGKAAQAIDLGLPEGWQLLVGRMTPEERREYLRRIARQD